MEDGENDNVFPKPNSINNPVGRLRSFSFPKPIVNFFEAGSRIQEYSLGSENLDHHHHHDGGISEADVPFKKRKLERNSSIPNTILNPSGSRASAADYNEKKKDTTKPLHDDDDKPFSYPPTLFLNTTTATNSSWEKGSFVESTGDDDQMFKVRSSRRVSHDQEIIRPFQEFDCHHHHHHRKAVETIDFLKILEKGISSSSSSGDEPQMILESPKQVSKSTKQSDQKAVSGSRDDEFEITSLSLMSSYFPPKPNQFEKCSISTTASCNYLLHQEIIDPERSDHNRTTVGPVAPQESPSPKVSKKRKQRRNHNDDIMINVESPPPIIVQIIESQNGTDTAFLYRKKLEISDVNQNLHRLLITRDDNFKEFMNADEKEAAFGIHGLRVATVDPKGELNRVCLKKWNTSKHLILNKGWKNIVSKNSVEAGHTVELWGYRKINGEACLAVNFVKPPAQQQQQQTARSSTDI